MPISYDFDKVIDRRGTNSEKWDFCKQHLGADGVLPMWVADMDFRAPAPVLEAVTAAARHGVFGYTEPGDAVYQAVIGWAARRYGWELRREWVSLSPGVMPALNLAIQNFTRPGDTIIVQPPVYPPFFRSVEQNGRRLASNHLVERGGRWELDFDGLEGCVDGRAKMLILCNPQNPTGRVFTRAELETLAEFALRHRLLVFSDDIHADLICSGLPHIPFASLGPEIARRTITGISPTKTFNIPGLGASAAVIPDAGLKRDFDSAMRVTIGGDPVNQIGLAALEAAWTRCDAWIDSLRVYLAGNVGAAQEFFSRELPSVGFNRPEGTYLAWLDFGRLGLPQPEIVRRLLEIGRIGLSDGAPFRPLREGFMRINLGCPAATLSDGLARIKTAFKEFYS